MKWVFKWLFRLIFLLVVLIVALLLSKDTIIKAAAERQIRAQTGMDVKIGKFSVGIFSPVVTIENFKLYNSPEFGGTPFINIPELHVEYDRAALAKRRIHITLMRFNLAELNVVRNEAGQTNMVSLMARADAKVGGTRRKRAANYKFAGIDVLNLSLGKVRYLDLKDPRQNGELDISVKNQVFRNLKSERDVFGVLFMIWTGGEGSSSGGSTVSPSGVLPSSNTNFPQGSIKPAAAPARPGKK